MERKRLLVGGLLLLSSLFFPQLALTQTPSQLTRPTLENAGGFVDTVNNETGLPAGTVQSISGFIIQIALSIVGIIFFLLMVYGGFLWMTAKGNEDQVTKAKSLIIAAIIGIAVVVSAYAMANFITNLAVKSAQSVG